VEFAMCGLCVNFHHEGDIYISEWHLHRLGEVSLALGGGRSPRCCGLHNLY
jgi:hypothetical protein